MKQTSNRRKAASRANGAKSRGPVTAAGKAKSRLNSTKHGCLATVVTLTPEDAETFRKMQELYVARYQPRDQVEYDMVEQIAFYNYQMREAWMREAAILGLQMSEDKETVDMEWGSNLQPRKRAAIAYLQSTKDSNALLNLERYARALSNQADKITKSLLKLRELRLPPTPQPELRNEPNPRIEHLQPAPISAPSGSSVPQLTTNIPQLTTGNWQLLPRNWQLTTGN